MNRITSGRAAHDSPEGGAAAAATPIDLGAPRSYRYGRVQRLLKENDCAAALLINPINIRHATDSRRAARRRVLRGG